MKILGNLNLSKGQLQNAIIHPLAAAPSSPIEGQIYYDTTDKVIYYWNGTAWVDTGLSASEIKTLYESNADTNALTDALLSKLNGIEAGADVTDTDNVTAAGALMDSEVDADIKTLSLPANTTISTFGATLVDDADASAAQSTLGVDPAGTDNSTDVTLNADDATQQSANLSGQELQLNQATNSTDGVMSAEDKSKLDGIEAGADVTDSTNVDAAGAVMNSDTSTASMSFVVDEDDMSSNSNTKVPTQQSVKAYVDNIIAAGVEVKGGYDASTNTPDLDTSPSGVIKGDLYKVTAAGNFFTELVEVGDTLIATVDDAATLSEWIVIQDNIDAATESAPGYIELATQAEVTTGTDDARAVTPLKLKTNIDARIKQYATEIGNGSLTSIPVTHNLNTRDVMIALTEVATNEIVYADFVKTTVDVVTVTFTTAPTTNQYRILITNIN